MKKRIVAMAFGMVMMCTAVTSCNPKETLPTETPQASEIEANTQIGSESILTAETKGLIIEHFMANGPYKRTYFVGEDVGEAQSGDQRIDKVIYVGEEPTGETTGVAFQVERSYYNTWHSDDPTPSWRNEQCSVYIILGRNEDGQYYEVRGTYNLTKDVSVRQIVLEVSYNLIDLEVSLWRDGYSQPVGPGSEITFFDEVDDGNPKVELLEDWEPVYSPGAYWCKQSWDEFTATCYYFGEGYGVNSSYDYCVNAIDTKRTDMETMRGIRVGATREDVLKAYPEIYDSHYWNDTDPDFPGADYLWYCNNEDGWGAAILFFFDGDIVSQIRLDNMFN